ncbi:MAG TPA: glycerol-3-phosphate 1-O-acyltransferase PlsY [Phycisphaerae bacterium]|nr:glycerol-3-phosphate 1-O-acyltransferase PlsY [Phycisphaerae bacterium]
MAIPTLIVFALLPIAGYLCGSIPFAWVIGKAKGVDIRTVGSKNIGATNLGRTFGKNYFFYAFFLDAAKGFFPVLTAALLTRMGNVYGVRADGSLTRDFTGIVGVVKYGYPSWAPLLTAVACVLGHNFPLWLKFKGGKGVATSFGVVLGFWPLYTLAGLLGAGAFVFTLMVYRFISLASMVGACFFFAAVLILGSNPKSKLTFMSPHELLPLAIVAGLLALMIIVRHRGNIRRLLNGTEPRVGRREIEKAQLRGEKRSQ